MRFVRCLVTINGGCLGPLRTQTGTLVYFDHAVDLLKGDEARFV